MANEINNNYKKQPTTNTQKTEDNKTNHLQKKKLQKRLTKEVFLKQLKKYIKQLLKIFQKKFLKKVKLGVG